MFKGIPDKSDLNANGRSKGEGREMSGSWEGSRGKEVLRKWGEVREGWRTSEEVREMRGKRGIQTLKSKKINQRD